MNRNDAIKIELEIREADGRVSRCEMKERDSLLVGRGKDCDRLVEGDRALSRHHFLLRTNRALVLIRDLGSHNNTFVNGKGIGGGDWTVLHDRDAVQAGKTSFLVHIQTPAHCIDCGCRIPDEERGRAQYLRGTFLCMKCRDGGKISAEPAPRKVTPEAFAGELLKRMMPVHEKAPPPAIDGYEGCELIGEGGFGAVYKARRLSDGEIVAIKTMLQTRKNNDCDCGLFKREQEICLQLKHPNIVEVYRFGGCGDTHFIEMEYLEGGTLHDRMNQFPDSRIPFPEASEIMLQCASGLAYAHSAPLVITTRHGRKEVNGIVHRDLKPANIIFARQGDRRTAKISDCGLAKAFELAGMTVGSLTRSGVWRGTLFYLSPEHIARYHDVEPVTDVFELAATFFHMLTGVGVWPLEKNVRPDQVILNGRPRRLRDHAQGLPPAVCRVFDDALAPRPEDRIRNGREFLNALKAAL